MTVELDEAADTRDDVVRAPRYSIAIPNFNYGHYVGRTIRSVLDQDVSDLEVLVSDNASSDDSVDVVRSFGDPRVQLRVNRTNVGFAGNLDRAVGMGSGTYVILLSSDDVMAPGALSVYDAVHRALGRRSERAVVFSQVDVIDADDSIQYRRGPSPGIWTDQDVDPALSSALGRTVYAAEPGELLRRAMLRMRNPLVFASTCYPRALYDAVEGYGGGRLINPDKWFHWRLLGEAEVVVMVQEPLFRYRVHARNQSAQQAASGALKHLVDEYVMTFETPPSLLERAGLRREDLVAAFVQSDVIERAAAELAAGRTVQARRMLAFGRATYPKETLRSAQYLAVCGAAALGPVGRRAAARVLARRGAR